MNIDQLIDDLIGREGVYANYAADKGGPTKWGVTEAVARMAGSHGAMYDLPRYFAVALCRRTYWLRPGFDRVLPIAPGIAAELFDTGVNMRPSVAAGFLQRALNALNRGGRDFADLPPWTRIDDATLAALAAFLKTRAPHGERAAQGARGAAGRTMPPPSRGSAGQRSLSQRLARQAAGVISSMHRTLKLLHFQI